MSLGPDTEKKAERKAFRQHCADWLQHNKPSLPAKPLPSVALALTDPEQLTWLQRWQQAAYAAGLIGCDYPKEVGGGGKHNYQRIANEEMQKAGVPFFPNPIGLGMAAPTIFYHASDTLKQTLLPKIFSGEHIWCQGFSEPGAGSDLANVQTFARREGNQWVIHGHKVWTSLAHFAEWMILLARTDKTDKYNGLTFFVVPIRAALGKGVNVRPLIKATGEAGFNEVIFDGLVVDDAYRLDAVGKGWQVAMTTLTHERGAGQLITPSAAGQSEQDYRQIAGVNDVLALARQSPRAGKSAIDDPLVCDRLMQLLIREEAMMQSFRLHAVEGLREHPLRIPLQGKLVISELIQDAAELALEIEGPASTLTAADPNAPAAGRWPTAYIASFANTIAAGSSEIQRNILGERVLNLPKSR